MNRSKTKGRGDRLFYDGHCGLCHGTVRFTLPRDRGIPSLRFSPLQGKTIQKLLSKGQRAGLPDSLVVLRGNGELLTKSTAVAYLLKRMGAAWPALGTLLGVLPRGLRDLGYDLVARVRYRIFGKPEEVCPLLPPGMRDRFEP
jgi:predicted DCC family thiol-disulfide oxidoreductase YuxK